MLVISLNDCHLPDDNKEASEEDSHAINDLYECHLPDEYVDASVLCYSDDDSDTSESEEGTSAKDLLSHSVPIRWLQNNGYSTKQLPEERYHLSDIALNECHLPDEYIDTMVSYDSSDSEESSPVEEVIGSVINFPWLGSNDNATEKPRPAMNDIFLNACHLPDDYVDVVLSSYGTDLSEGSKELSSKHVKSNCVETTSAEPSPSLDHLMERLNKIISAGPIEDESCRNGKHPWVGDKASQAEKDGAAALMKAPIIGNSRGKGSLETQVPPAKVSRGALRRKQSKYSVSGFIQ